MEVLVMEKWDLQMGVLVIFNGRIIEKKRGVFHCHVWLPDGRLWNCSVLILGQVGIDHTSPPQKIHPVKDRMFAIFRAPPKGDVWERSPEEKIDYPRVIKCC